MTITKCFCESFRKIENEKLQMIRSQKIMNYQIITTNKKRYGVNSAVVAEWLRRLTRNQIPFGSAGSNPADCESFVFPATQ
jgi:hypothetical protein